MSALSTETRYYPHVNKKEESNPHVSVNILPSTISDVANKNLTLCTMHSCDYKRLNLTAKLLALGGLVVGGGSVILLIMRMVGIIGERFIVVESFGLGGIL